MVVFHYFTTSNFGFCSGCGVCWGRREGWVDVLPYKLYVLRYAPSQGVWFLSCFGLRMVEI